MTSFVSVTIVMPFISRDLRLRYWCWSSGNLSNTS